MKSKDQFRYTLVGQSFNREDRITVLIIFDQQQGKEFRLTSAEAIHDEQFIQKMPALDAMRIGFIAGMETMRLSPV